MGDRAFIQLCNSRPGQPTQFTPTLYMHWGGSDVYGLIKKWWTLMSGRRNDEIYGIARLCGLAHAQIPDSNLSLGLYNSPTEWTDSHGDFGIALINVEAETIKLSGGYGFSMDPPKRHEGTWTIPELYPEFR